MIGSIRKIRAQFLLLGVRGTVSVWGASWTSKEGLKKIAWNDWTSITPENLNMLYESMPRQMQAVVDAQGGHTKYKTIFDVFLS